MTPTQWLDCHQKLPVTLTSYIAEVLDNNDSSVISKTFLKAWMIYGDHRTVFIVVSRVWCINMLIQQHRSPTARNHDYAIEQWLNSYPGVDKIQERLYNKEQFDKEQSNE